MKNAFYILVIFISTSAFAQPDTMLTGAYGVDSLIEAELQEYFAQKSSVSKLGAISDEQLLTFFSENGVAIDSLCPNYELYREIYGWLGTRYVYAGLTKNGVDCAGFVANICNKIYGTNLAGSATHYIDKCEEIIDTTQLKEGDLLFFKINKTEISHVAFYLGGGRFVHAALNGGVRFDDLSMAYYAKYYFTAGRLKPIQITGNGN